MGMVPEYFRLPQERLMRGLSSFAEAQRLTEELIEFSAACVLNPEEVARSPFGVADPDKAWDAIHYTLDPGRRAGKRYARTTGLGGRLILGATPAPDPLRKQPKWWIGYTMTSAVQALAEELRTVNFGALLATAQLGGVTDQLYSNYDDARLVYWYEQLARLYWRAADLDQAVLILES
ncbi:MAG: DUF1877 family protein [Bacteroidota bacterium]